MQKALSQDSANLLRQIPSVDIVLKQMTRLIDQFGHLQVSQTVQRELSLLRDIIRSDVFEPDLPSLALSEIVKRVERNLSLNNQASLLPVFNLSGTVLHTNLGRAVLPQQALHEVVRVAGSASNLEYDLKTGQRGERDTHIEELICELTGAEAATAVNNNAAAVLLVLNTLAMGKEVPISRGELVEIGGSFRIPEVMQRSGTLMVEIGTTNRTHLKDYENALTESTGALLKVHTSNYRIEGFTNEVSERELAELAQHHQVPFVFDMGSGSLIDYKSLGLPAEQTVAEALSCGTDIVTFSGDKLLGGPQCGIIAGKKELIEKIRTNPLKRALRLDKMTLAALSAVLKLYRNPESLIEQLPALRSLTRKVDAIEQQAERIMFALKSTLPNTYLLSVIDCFSQIGSGALPVETIPSKAISIASSTGQDSAIRRLTEKLRQLPKPVIARVHNGTLLLDLRCLDNEVEFIEQMDTLRELLQ